MNKELKPMIEVSELDRKKLKKAQIEILLKFKDFCDKHSLSFFLSDGTLLGAVRHKGYIPWDDDVDVCMPRKDYDYLITHFDEFDENFFVECRQTDENYFLDFAKIMKKDTSYIEYTVQNIDYRKGIFIDIFPMNKVPFNKMKRRLYRFTYYLWTLRGFPKLPGHENIYGMKTSKKAFSVFANVLLFWCSKKKAILIRDNYVKKHQDLKSDCYLIGTSFLKKDLFDEKTEVDFEGYKMPSPKNYDAYLSSRYGNYMELPPVEERVGHHYIVELKY